MFCNHLSGLQPVQQALIQIASAFNRIADVKVAEAKQTQLPTVTISDTADEWKVQYIERFGPTGKQK